MLPAGDLVLYPGTTVHRVEPATRGVRLAAFFWIQSMVRDATHRSIVFDLDRAVQRLGADVPGHPSLVDLAGVYHNLLRCWADACRRLAPPAAPAPVNGRFVTLVNR